MKENRYDDQEFFEKYRHMSRSEKGLAGAGEWPLLQKMLPDFTQKQVLDLGCGYGWHCRYAIEKGAASVLGIDLSEKMLDQARKINQPSGVEYLRCALEDYTYPTETYDIVISSLTLHYIEDLSALFTKVMQTLRIGGEFIFSMEHPIFTAEGRQQWLDQTSAGNPVWPVTRYFLDGRRDSIFLDVPVVKYHHSLTTIVQALLRNGFELEDIQEPRPTAELIREVPQMEEELHRPMMIIFKSKKR